MQEKLPSLSVRVRPYNDDSDRPTRLIAFAELIIADAFVIKGIRILKKADGSEEPFVVFPAEKGKGSTSDRWFDLAHPITQEAREATITMILAEYAKIVKAKV